MGFDLYGMNPVIRKGKMPVEPKDLWKKGASEEKRNKYYDKKWEFEENNPGSYFRNNVWGWRGLWDYVYNECRDVLTEEDWNNGHHNEGHKISEEKAVVIGKRLNDLIKSGKAKRYVALWEDDRKEAIEHNKSLKKGMGDKNYDWKASYPLYLENIQEFATFCSESGGFEIR